MFAIRKTALDDELARLEELLSRQETRIQQAFLEFVREAKDPRLVRQAADLLSRGAVDDALALLDSHIARLASVIPAVIQNAATAELAGLAAAIQPIRPTVAVSFDPTDPEAATKIRDATMEFIVQFTDAQRESTRQALAGGFDSGAGTQEMARAFRDSIGLTSTQEAAVRNYRSLLQAGSSDALERALRDRRHDRSVQRAVDGGAPLTPEQVDTMVMRYRNRYLAYRAETIARTEATPAVELAREEALRQNIATAGIGAQAVEQRWNTTMDGRERHTHRSMNAQVVPLGQSFLSPSGAHLRYPGDPRAPAAEIVNCRCRRSYKINAGSILAPV